MINVLDFKKLICQYNNYIDDGITYHFYYDETNNYRKVRIRNNELNVPNAFTIDYVLGGFCCTNSTTPNIEKLFETSLQKYKTVELKSKNLYRKCKAFLDYLDKEETKIILKWIKENGFVHYTTMNCFYFTVIDLVDSFFVDDALANIPNEYINIVKSEMFFLLELQKEEFLKLASKVNYPNVKANNIRVFCDGLIDLINNKRNNNSSLELFKKIVESMKYKNNLLFLKGHEEKTIVPGFGYLRQQKCIIFDSSFHTFDDEIYDENYMKNYPLTVNNNGILKNYEFKSSISERLIQISDIVVSILSKFFTYIDATNSEVIRNEILNLNKIQKESLVLLFDLINSSNEQNSFFLASVNPQDINLSRRRIISFIEELL